MHDPQTIRSCFPPVRAYISLQCQMICRTPAISARILTELIKGQEVVKDDHQRHRPLPAAAAAAALFLPLGS
jgi:hypothetical protein